jgi:hypothetical protein
VAASECDVVFARLGNSLDRYLRPDRHTAVSAHRQTLSNLIAKCEYFGIKPMIWGRDIQSMLMITRTQPVLIFKLKDSGNPYLVAGLMRIPNLAPPTISF